MSVTDRAAALVVGGALGDALGARYEGLPLRWPTVAVRPGRSLQLWRRRLYWTDDTEMSLAVLLARQQVGHDPNRPISDSLLQAIVERFVAWRTAGVLADMGTSTIRVLGALKHGEVTVERALASAQRVNTAGNGAMMRSSAVALLHPGDEDETYRSACRVAALTHGSPDAQAAAAAMAVLLTRALVGDGSLDGLGRFPLTEAVALAVANPTKPRLGRAKGWAPATLSGVLWSIGAITARLDPAAWLNEGLRRSVGAGGDTDTNAALVGSWLAARCCPAGFADTLDGLPRWAGQVHGGDWSGRRLHLPELAQLAIGAVNAPSALR